ncbi:asparagine synthetase domain-containing protein CG17486 isoform X4 [Musca domestica]|uniref:Asparagine synthetase domain-containing protein CG17486 isoform X4 n=1 Tax=Musca domestica TaxID=7370 RepID=A0ABM3ULU4_MUSDO|nr:asparagine synthetase domain-containing protein CG17486 isoform X4 [Musca domestica]
MCGILCCFSKTDHECLSKELIGILHNRGPNSESILTVNEIIFAGFVLHHQGTEMCPQPIKTDRHIFIFNGDVFNLPRNACEISDTNWIFNKISGAKDERALISCFRSIEGPFSFILYDNRLGNLFFGRDSLGRNSLLMENSKSHLRILSTSYLSQDKRTEIAAVELPPLGIYKINKDNNKCCVVFPWQQPEEHWIAQARSLEATIGVRVLVECPIEPSWLSISTINHKYWTNQLVVRSGSPLKERV